MENNDTWYCVLNNQHTEKLSESDMIDMIERKIINADTMVWQQGFVDWFPLKETTLCVHLPKTPPQTKSSNPNRFIPNNKLKPNQNQIIEYDECDECDDELVEVDNTIVWVLAFAPIVGGVIDIVLGIWISTLLINIGLSIWDEKNLQKQGIDTDEFCSFGGAWLVPVYLYERAKYFEHSQAYFSVWLITFILSGFMFI